MVNLYLIIKSSGRLYESIQDWDRDDSILSRKTAGQLLQDLKNKKLAPQKTLDFFTVALKKRNNLAHRFFFDNAAHFMIEAGMKEMADELCTMTETFEQADKLTKSIIDPLSDAMGVLPSDIEEERKRLIDEAVDHINKTSRYN